MKQYRKIPLVIEAVQFTGQLASVVEILKFCPEFTQLNDHNVTIPVFGIPTLEGTMKVSKGDYIIKGVQGEFYPCKPDIFEKTYEEVKP